MKVAGPVAFFWFRRDLRLDDNAGLYHALKSGLPVIPLFIFDTNILDELPEKADKRVQFIHNEVVRLNQELTALGSGLLVKHGKPLQVWEQLLAEYDIRAVFANNDHEVYARRRDQFVGELLAAHKCTFNSFKDIVIFEKDEVLKDDGTPYTVFTPYSKKWRAKLKPFYYKSYPTQKYSSAFYQGLKTQPPVLVSLGFKSVEADYPERKVKNDIVKNYTEKRDYPAMDATSRLSLHLRFGTLSIRRLLAYALERNQTYVNELIWRDFYHQILWNFPDVEKHAFKKQYDLISWRKSEDDFKKWCEGKTGYPLVDAGMRELNATGFMHNRVRMVVASFLTKHLLIDWRWGEAYFAQKLLDFDLAANNGGWQWAAGSGTDAAPYFRIFNPTSQQQRFDPQMEYIKRWVPEYGTPAYPQPMVEHELARKRCLQVYQAALKGEQ